MEATVLLADDSAEFTEMLQAYLEQHNYKVVTVSSGQEAIDYLSSNQHADVILLDVMMPGLDGWDQCPDSHAHRARPGD